MDEVARRRVEGHTHFSAQLRRKGNQKSWMTVLNRLHVLQRMIEEAMAAAPAIFAKPGDVLCTRDRNSSGMGDSRVEYQGRDKRGWLIFHNNGFSYPLNVTSGGIRDTLNAWPERKYSVDSEEQNLCIPPEMCSPMNLDDEYDDDGNEIPLNIQDRVKQLTITWKMLAEAKKAVPLLVAKKGDLFEWSGYYDTVVVKYKGRNKIPSRPIEFRGGSEQYTSPEIGWLVFHNRDKRCNAIDVVNRGIRDAISAWPMAAYSHYNKSGERIDGTLCIPFEKCGALQVYKEPYYDGYW